MFPHTITLLLGSLLLTRLSVAQEAVTTDQAKLNRCFLLSSALPGKVFSPGSPTYVYENSEFWSQTQLLSPACVFRPASAKDVSTGIEVMKAIGQKFAVRGGGHMAIKGSNNIDSGVLMVMSNLTTLSLSRDNSIVSIGPAYRWGDVYAWLQTQGLTVAGGRLSPVGVPGLLLGGGINFYGNQKGFSADTVVRYEVVLASGKIVYATKTVNPDLFWALKGGSSNFGIVTRFDVETIPTSKVWAGVYSVAPDRVSEFLAATANYSANIVDPLSHIIPAVVSVAPGVQVGAVILFYDSPTVSFPPAFAPFTNIPSISSSLGFKTVTEFAAELGAVVVPDINDVFVAGTVVGKSYAELLRGVQIINDVFFAATPALYAQIPAANIVALQIDWQPIGLLWMKATAAKGGNALGLDPSKGVYLCYAEVVEWNDSQYDQIVADWVVSTTNAINAATKAAGLFDPFNYMGDAAGFQSIYPGYGAANQQKLLSISRKYDPERVFQTLLPGGFKIGR